MCGVGWLDQLKIEPTQPRLSCIASRVIYFTQQQSTRLANLPATCLLAACQYACHLPVHLPANPLNNLPAIEGHLPSKVVFHHRSSSIKSCLPWKVVFHQRIFIFLIGRIKKKIVKDPCTRTRGTFKHTRDARMMKRACDASCVRRCARNFTEILGGVIYYLTNLKGGSNFWLWENVSDRNLAMSRRS